jgi:hypothetical protein
MRIALIVEGKTEQAFLPPLRKYLETRLADKMPKIVAIPQNGRIPKEEKLKRLVENLLLGPRPYDAVIALTDVYTSKNLDTRDFTDAADAKRQMRKWVGENPKFYPHAAQHDFEAWLLPYWESIKDMAEHDKSAPSGKPEDVNHDKSPAYHIAEIFRLGKKREYIKPREALAILSKKDNDLNIAIRQCPELKSFINTFFTLCGSPTLP